MPFPSLFTSKQIFFSPMDESLSVGVSKPFFFSSRGAFNAPNARLGVTRDEAGKIHLLLYKQHSIVSLKMFSFHLLIYICLSPMWLQTPIHAWRRDGIAYSAAAGPGTAPDTAKRSARVCGAPSTRAYFKVCFVVQLSTWGSGARVEQPLSSVRSLPIVSTDVLFVLGTCSKLLSHRSHFNPPHSNY